MRRRSYAKRWGLNPYGTEIWGNLANGNVLGGLTDEQLLLDELAQIFENKEVDKMYNTTNKPKENIKSDTLQFSAELLKEMEIK